MIMSHIKNKLLFLPQLVDSAMDQASEVFKTNEDHELLAALKQAGLQGNAAKVSELALTFEEHTEQIQEVGWSLLLLMPSPFIVEIKFHIKIYSFKGFPVFDY